MPFRQHLHGLVANSLSAVLSSAVDRELLPALSEVTTIRLLRHLNPVILASFVSSCPSKFGGIP